MRREVANLVRRVLRYGGVGLAISLIYSVAVVACMGVSPVSPTAASVIAFVVILPLAYLSHARISFSDRPRDPSRLLRFAISTGSSFLIAVGGMYLITEIAGGAYWYGIALNWLVIPALNFAAYMFWVFRTSKQQEKPA